MGYKKTDTCIQKAFDDEPLFVLMARDPMAYPTVMFWISLSESHHDGAKIEEAKQIATKMFELHQEFRIRAEDQKTMKVHASAHEGKISNATLNYQELQRQLSLEIKSNEALRKAHAEEKKKAEEWYEAYQKADRRADKLERSNNELIGRLNKVNRLSGLDNFDN